MDNSLSLRSPGNEIQIPIEFRNRSFAIRAHVRQVSDMTSRTNVAAGDNGELAVRTVVYVEDEIENALMDVWEMTTDGTPFFRTLTTNFIDPGQSWPFWPYRTTLIRKDQKDRPWTVVELSRKFQDMRNPFGMIDQFLLTIGFEDECESLTLLGVEPQTLLDLGLVVVDESGDVVFGQEEFEVTGLREEPPAAATSGNSQIPAVLPPENGGQLPDACEVEPGEEIQAVPEIVEESNVDSLTVHDGLVVTARSTVKLLRDACRWYGVSQAGSKGRMFERCKAAHEMALKRSLIEAAQDQYRSLQHDADPVSVPPQPSDRDRSLHDLTHTPYQPWYKFCVMSRAKANHHSHIPDPEGDAQREHPTIQCDFFFMEPGKEGAVVALLAVDVWSRYVTVVPLKRRNAQTVGQALVKFINHVRDGTVEIAFDNEPVLVAGVAFCKAARAKTGYTTITTPNKMYDKGRTGVAERFVQTIRELQKTLLCHIEAEIKATIPSGHVVVQWAAMHASWLYNRYNVHSTYHIKACGDDHTKARLLALGRQYLVWTQKLPNTNLLGGVVHGWARTLLTTTLSVQMGNASSGQKLSERFPVNGMQNYFWE